MTRRRKQSRRLFLRGVGGAVVAAPFLGSVAERRAKAEGEPPPAAPRRLIIMFTHYGCLTDRWFPENSHGELAASDFTGTSLEPLAPHAKKILMPRGIRAMNEWTPDASLGQGNAGFTAGSYFTCAPLTPHSSDPFQPTQGSRFSPYPTAPSLDHVCAKQLSEDGFPLLLRLAATESQAAFISFLAPEEPYFGISNPAQVLAALGETPGNQAAYKIVRGESVVDLVKGDLESLERVDMSASDKHKLEAWKELLHATSGAVTTVCTPDLATSLGLTEENVDLTGSIAVEWIATKITDSMDGADLFSNLAVLSALCDPSRVTVLKYPGSYTFRGLGLDLDNHSIATRTGSSVMTGECITGANDLILTIDRYYAAKFAHLVQQLDAIEEGDGTLLDNTAAVWFQEFSDGAAMNLNNLPIVQAGSCGGYFKTGWAVNVDGGAPDLHRGNSSAACEVAGAITEFKETGTPSEFANAPINKYFCNLMNAIGVKAGSDGFPLVGGTEAVTHFGMYDDTRDFASGGENPPQINDPGEFPELRAST